ncbi:MAG: alanine--tRNA ligase, partial [Deltaproteobacteria bacterium]|nr:alanine--tRNA ligase [Deltaproteobacteria bacterium]
EGRGYVLRRIIRRAVRHGYFLGLRKPFLYKVADLVTDIMGEVYPEAKNASSLIGKATLGEEERFFETIERGLGLLEEEVKKLKKENKKTLDGETAFKLYDTYGFPLDLTADIIKRENLSVDEDGFNEAMEAQRQMARKSWKGTDETLATDEVLKKLRDKGVTSEFLGYDNKKITDKIITILKDGEEVESAKANDEVSIITSKTPFYAESGGQTGDRGTIKSSNSSIDINDTKKIIAGIISHTGKVKTGTIKVGDKVELEPNKERRIATARNHTATHILHSALRETLGEHVRQAGSLVTEDSLRFDFNHFQGLTSTEIRTIEEKANKAILENINVVTQSLPYKEALKKGALAFFGEKYGETVRMVQVGGVSTELCGGTHVSATGEIGLIKIKSEGSVASGVRRIEALSGLNAIRSVLETEDTLKESALLLKGTKSEVPEKIKKILSNQKELERELSKAKQSGSSGDTEKLIESAEIVCGVKVVSGKVELSDPKELRQIADTLRKKIKSGIIILGLESNGKAMLLATVTKDLCERFSAGEIIKNLAPIVGGKGGGKADMAQAGGKDLAKLTEAITTAKSIIEKIGK